MENSSKQAKTKSVAELLQLYPQLVLQPNNKILCTLTNHEMAPQFEAIHSHVNGKKFKKAMEWYSHDYSQYEPFIVPHKSDNKKLFCTLTKQALNKIPEEIKKHWEGKRFQRLMLEKQNSQKESKQVKKIEKPVIEENEDEEPDCWVPDFPLDDSDEEEEDEEGIAGSEEEIDEEDELVEDGEEEEEVEAVKPSTKKSKLSKVEKHSLKDSKNKKKGEKRSRVDDLDDEEFILRKTASGNKKKGNKKQKNKN